MDAYTSNRLKKEDMKRIEVNYTIEIDHVLAYWQSKLEHLWNERQAMDEEIEIIDNTISYLQALKSAMSAQIDIVIKDESENGN